MMMLWALTQQGSPQATPRLLPRHPRLPARAALGKSLSRTAHLQLAAVSVEHRRDDKPGCRLAAAICRRHCKGHHEYAVRILRIHLGQRSCCGPRAHCLRHTGPGRRGGSGAALLVAVRCDAQGWQQSLPTTQRMHRVLQRTIRGRRACIMASGVHGAGTKATASAPAVCDDSMIVGSLQGVGEGVCGGGGRAACTTGAGIPYAGCTGSGCGSLQDVLAASR